MNQIPVARCCNHAATGFAIKISLREPTRDFVTNGRLSSITGSDRISDRRRSRISKGRYFNARIRDNYTIPRRPLYLSRGEARERERRRARCAEDAGLPYHAFFGLQRRRSRTGACTRMRFLASAHCAMDVADWAMKTPVAVSSNAPSHRHASMVC